MWRLVTPDHGGPFRDFETRHLRWSRLSRLGDFELPAGNPETDQTPDPPDRQRHGYRSARQFGGLGRVELG